MVVSMIAIKTVFFVTPVVFFLFVFPSLILVFFIGIKVIVVGIIAIIFLAFFTQESPDFIMSYKIEPSIGILYHGIVKCFIPIFSSKVIQNFRPVLSSVCIPFSKSSCFFSSHSRAVISTVRNTIFLNYWDISVSEFGHIIVDISRS